MNLTKRAAAALLTAIFMLSLLSGCREETPQQKAVVPEELSVCLGPAPKTLDPAYATELQDKTILSHLYENLMKLSVDENGNPTSVPAMAKSYEEEKNVDGSVTYTFRLRNAKWSDGTAVTAEDFVYAWQRLADPATASPHQKLLSIVKGYDEVQSSGDVTALQVEAKNNSTFTVTITGTCEWFLTDVCTAAATSPLRKQVIQQLQESDTSSWEANYTEMVCNGPYCLEAVSLSFLTLGQNERYTENDDGPKTIRIIFAATPEEGWALYEEGKVDFLAELPESQLKVLAENPQWTPLAKPTTCLLLFNTRTESLSDPLVRQALQLAIDRSALSALAGASYLPASGLVSSSVPDADASAACFRAHGGDLVNIDPANIASNRADAQQLLYGAGYDMDFPLAALQLLHPDTERHGAAARELADTWAATLNVSVTPVAMEEAQLKEALSAGQFSLAITDFTAYANDAQSFLESWSTGDPANVVGYSNSAFDTLLAVIRSASDDAARRGCLHDAESLLLEDCPLTPLYFSGTAYALRDGLTGLVRNPLGSFCFSDIAQIILPETP